MYALNLTVNFATNNKTSAKKYVNQYRVAGGIALFYSCKNRQWPDAIYDLPTQVLVTVLQLGGVPAEHVITNLFV